ncbi:MAG: S9 family peptidase, partial [Chloroflexia bacterium]|nr:S9 family peptidase [Chloroflexia bacterium]
SNERRLTDHNQELLGEIHLSAPQELKVSAPDGKSIQAWILPPPGFDETSGVKHRLITQIHGGPHAMYGDALFHEMQLMAARGYAVLYCNPRGSVGYGEDFATTTRGRWGESDMPDVMASVDAAVALGWIDDQRLGLTGGSYGGYLTNWIIGHSDRFKAAVTQRCVANFASFFGTSDIGYDFGEHEFGGVPWNDSDLLRKHSPITYVESMNTPLLILHSEQDLRCPIEQAEQLFTSLKFLGREVAFVRFPEEGHDLSRSGKPSRRLARLHHLIGWFDRHL